MAKEKADLYDIHAFFLGGDIIKGFQKRLRMGKEGLYTEWDMCKIHKKGTVFLLILLFLRIGKTGGEMVL